jgi:RNA polymerase sigma-70 factor (ECF subfamily)
MQCEAQKRWGGKMADEVLVASAKSGDRQAFNELVIRHQSSLLRLCMRFTNSPDLAEDIVQDAFVKAYKKLSSFEGRSSFKSWLFQIAVNTAKNKLRSQKDTVNLDQVQISMGTICADGIERKNLQDMIRDFVDELPDKQKTALTLRIYDDLSFKEIAEIMECPYDTAKANYRHGLMNMKKALEKKNMMNQLRQNSDEGYSMEIEMIPFRAEGEI